MSGSDGRILLGHISAAHGLKGEVLVKTYTGAPQDIAAYGPLESEDGGRRVALKVMRVTPKGVIARIAGVGDRTAAEALAGLRLYVERAALPPADEGEFYHADLLGLTAVSEDGTTVGEVVAVENYGAGDLLEIRLAGTGRTELVPFTDAFVPTVDLAGRRVVVLMPELVAAEDGMEDAAPEGNPAAE
jgi:16S rRNA processing protein RimM